MRRDVVVLGASAGGVAAVSRLLSELPGGFPGSMFVVVHIPADQPSILPEVLRRRSALEVVRARDGAAIRSGHVYVAPTDRHLLLEDGVVRVVKGPHENRHRPAIDPLFRSAAFYYGRRAVGVLLTGADSDGTSGLFSIKMRGGRRGGAGSRRGPVSHDARRRAPPCGRRSQPAAEGDSSPSGPAGQRSLT